MRKSRKQILNRVAEVAGVTLVALDLALFFVVYRPLGALHAQATRSHDALRQTIRKQEFRVDLLKRYEAALPEAGKGLDEFASSRTPSRRQAYSTAAHLVHKVANDSGVKVVTIGYRFDKEQKEPLEKLELEINMQGPYQGLVKFAHALETSNQFILIREFTFTGGGEDAGLGLRLAADLYLTP